MSNTPSSPRPRLAILRLRDVCIRVQEGMLDHLRTASVEGRYRIEPTLAWLRRQGADVCLLSDFSAGQTRILLERLGWEVGPDTLVQSVITDQLLLPNPIERALEVHAPVDCRQTIAVVDTPRLLRLAHFSGLGGIFGVTNGSFTYAALNEAPHTSLLDGTVQIVDHLVRSWVLEEDVPQPVLRRSWGLGSRFDSRRIWSLGNT